MIFGIDPGPEKSAFVEAEITGLVGVEDHIVVYNRGWVENWEVLSHLCATPANVCAIEWLQSYGLGVGATTFETAYWCGRFAQVALTHGMTEVRVTRPKVASFVAGVQRPRDPDVRRGLIARFGSEKKGGPLYKITGHMWDALAVATYAALVK